MAVGWLADGTEQSLRAAMAACAPQLADLPIRINAWHAQSNPLWWSSSAVIDERFVVKFAWSEIRAIRLWREGMVLERLRCLEPSLPTPELVVLSRDPALVVTRRVPGVPLSWQWASGMSAQETTEVAQQVAAFLVRLHGVTSLMSSAISWRFTRRPRRTPRPSVVGSRASLMMAEQRPW